MPHEPPLKRLTEVPRSLQLSETGMPDVVGDFSGSRDAELSPHRERDVLPLHSVDLSSSHESLDDLEVRDPGADRARLRALALEGDISRV